MSQHVNDVLNKCSLNAVPREVPTRPQLSDDVYALAANVQAGSVAVAARDEFGTFKMTLGEEPQKARGVLKKLVDGDAALLGERKALLNALEPGPAPASQ